MVLRRERRRWGAIALTAVLLAGDAGAAATKHDLPGSALTPAAKIAVAPLGYMAPSGAYMNYRMALATVDFIDNEHLLFTFHASGLMRRIPGDPADDQDQTIHAVVVEIASGKAIREADWRMHDRQRYLWALRDGKFLVRQRNSLFLTDSRLELRPYLTFDSNLQAIELSPARELMLIEIEKLLPPEDGQNAATDETTSLFPTPGMRKKRTQMVLLRPGEKSVLGEGEMRSPRDLPLLDDGLLEVIEGQKPNDWMVERRRLRSESRAKDTDEKLEDVVGEVMSACTPVLEVVSDKVALAQGCPLKGASGSAVSAVSLEGGVLWHDTWDSKYVWPDFSIAVDGSRFAFGSLEMNRQVGTMDAFGEGDVVGQPVGVFDTDSGKLEMVRNATPILSGGHNFAVSADGRRFAILREGAIEVYDLPPVSANDPAKDSPAKK